MKRLHYKLLSLLLVITGVFAFSSCEGDKIYYEDPSFNWETLFYPVSATGYDSQGKKIDKWEWNPNTRRYQCIINISGDFAKLDEFIYNNGNAIGYVFWGEQYVDETQNLMPYYDDVWNANLWYDTSLLGKDRIYEVAFYFQWADGRQEAPPLYNLKLALFWGKMQNN